MSRHLASVAMLPTGVARDVLIEVEAGRFTRVEPKATAAGTQRLPGMAFPGFANCHSHAFHRALRGRTQHGTGTFWTWRQAMYAVASRLDPDRYFALARATYAEMALAGVTAVGEFHYLHHGENGRSYAEPNVMGEALRAAASDAGIRATVLDTCYLSGGLTGAGHQALDAVQQRFSDGTVDAWAVRAAEFHGDGNCRTGSAIHSVRAVPRDDLSAVVKASGDRPLHLHLSEQPAENEACQAFYGCSPTALLHDAGAWGQRTTAVHATALTGPDVTMLGAANVTACLCPTTERDLADGIGPARALADAGARLSLGSDQHAVIDLIEEARGLEMDERLNSGARGRFTPPELLDALTCHESLGWPDAGRIAVGQRADLVCLRTDTVRTAGADPDQLLYAATAADVDTVWVDGRAIVQDGRHLLGDVGRLLAGAVSALRDDARSPQE